MPEKLSAATRAKIYEMGRDTKLSNREIARQLGVDHSCVDKYRNVTPVSEAAANSGEPELSEGIRKILKRSDATLGYIADALDVSPKRVAHAIAQMVTKGAMISEAFGSYSLTPAFAAAPGTSEILSVPQGEWSHIFGVVSDNHLCNKHSRRDVLCAAYKRFESMGITTVYNAGNWIDGEARFNKTELLTRPGMDAQLDYMIDKYPQVKGITTYYIAGDDHEGWYQQREGVEIGRYLEFRSKDQGRNDLKYLGYGEADVSLRKGDGVAIMRIVHPGGGSSYAISYTDQKRVESYQGGEKPHIELAGHYHKANYGYPREVHAVQTGCTCDQTMFMRKKRLAAHIGFWVIKIAQDDKGAVTRFSPEWFPFFDRGYYTQSF